MINISLKENKEMKKIKPIKNAVYDWLINYINEPITKSVCAFKEKIISLFKTNTPKQTVYERETKLKKNLKAQKRSK